MQNLITNIPAVALVNVLKKWKVTYHNDNDNVVPPCVVVGVTLYDRYEINSVQTDVPWPIGQQMLYLYNATPSQVLIVNGSATSVQNQFLAANVSLAGTPYTTISNAINLVTGKAAQRNAIETLLVAAGALPASFAST
jgi:hypothetical protein